MDTFIKKNINIIISTFILLGPILDLITGFCLHSLNISLTLGIIVRLIFLIYMCLIVIFIFKKKKLIVPYLIIGLYFILYVLGMIIYDNTILFTEIQGLVKVFYFPILFISIYSIKDEIKTSKMTLFVILFLYLIFIFVPTLLGIGYKSYEVTKEGTLGFFNSANEVSGIISILTPIMFIILYKAKNLIPKLILLVMYLVVILMMGTKTPLISLIITLFVVFIYFGKKFIIEKNYKVIIISILVIIIGIISLVLVIPKTNFYKNIRTHLDYLGLNNITEVFSKEKYVDHFIFSSRIKFLKKKAKIYNNEPLYKKIFGIGYINNNKQTKMIEMDYFDIYYSHGIIGFIIFFVPIIYIIYKIFKNKRNKSFDNIMLYVSVLLIVLLSLLTGHIITSPSVSLLCIIIFMMLIVRNKKDLLIIYDNDISNIEDSINKDVYEVKVLNNNIKYKNNIRLLIFKIYYYMVYDTCICYHIDNEHSSELAIVSSDNRLIFINKDMNINKNKIFHYFKEIRIYQYNLLVFDNKIRKDKFTSIYNNLKDRCIIFKKDNELLNNIFI